MTKKNRMKKIVTLNSKYQELFKDDPNIFFFFLYSGRGAGKSFAISLFLATRLINGKGNLVFCRQYMTNAQTSIIPQFLDKIQILNIKKYLKINKNCITCLLNGNKLFFKGLQTAEGTAEASLKGIPNLACVVIDEMQEVKEQAFDRLIGTIRNKDLNLKVICALNPTSKKSWQYQRFFKGIKQNFTGKIDNRFYIYSSYFDNIKYLNEVAIHEIQNIKKVNIIKYNNQYLGKWLSTSENVLWNLQLLNLAKDFKIPENHTNSSYYLGVDIAVSTNKDSDETALTLIQKNNKEYYVLECIHGKFTPLQWSNKCKELKSKYRNLYIIAEKNNGGNLIQNALNNVGINSNIKLVSATKSKILRAQDILVLYQQNKVHHTKIFPKLQQEMLTYSGDPKEKSPNCLDSLVWALKEASQKSSSSSLYIQ